MLAAPAAVDLTPREQEFALLAAAGSSSRMIAERLVIPCARSTTTSRTRTASSASRVAMSFRAC